MSKHRRVVLVSAVAVLVASTIVGFALLDDLAPLGERLTSMRGTQLAQEPKPAVPDSSVGSQGNIEPQAPGPVPVPDLPPIGPKVIKTASLEVRVGEGKFQDGSPGPGR